MVPDCTEHITHVLPRCAQPYSRWRHAHFGDKTIALFTHDTVYNWDAIYMWRGDYGTGGAAGTSNEQIPRGAGPVIYEVYKGVMEEDYREAIDL